LSALETFFAVTLTLLSAAGLLLASRVLEGPDKRRRQFFCYYTNLSNAAMLLYHGSLLIPGRARAALLSPLARYLCALCILVTFVIYFFVLTRFGRHSKKDTMQSLGTRRYSNAIVHYLVPLLTEAEWLLAADKRGLGLRHAFIWLAVPLCYLVFTVARASTGVIIENTGSLWPYAFMDRDALGTKKWLRNLALALLGFFLLGLLLLGISRLYRY